MTHRLISLINTINQSFPSSCVSSCYRKACRQRWTSSYPHTWSVTSYWGLWWSFAGISFSFSQGNSRRVYVCVRLFVSVCLWNSGWLTAPHTVTHTDPFPTAPQSCRALRDPQTHLTHTCLTLQLASSPFAASVCMGYGGGGRTGVGLIHFLESLLNVSVSFSGCGHMLKLQNGWSWVVVQLWCS